MTGSRSIHTTLSESTRRADVFKIHPHSIPFTIAEIFHIDQVKAVFLKMPYNIFRLFQETTKRAKNVKTGTSGCAILRL